MNRLKRVDWLAVVIYPLAVILMEAFWIYPWLVWLGLWPAFAELRPVLSLASIIIVLVIPLLLTRVVIRQKWSLWVIQYVIVGCGLVTILLVLRFEYGGGYAFLDGGWFIYLGKMLGAMFTNPHTVVVALPVLLYLWWRGIVLGRTTSYFKNIYRSFLLGMVMLIVLIILWQISSLSGAFEGPVSSVGFHVMAFFFFGLTAIAIYHLYLMRRRMPREDAALTSVWRWLPIMLGVIGGIVVVGIGVASIFSPEFIASIEQGVKVVFGFLGKILYYVLIPFNFIFEGIYYILQFLISRLRNEQALQPGESGNRTIEGMGEVVPKEIPPEVTTVIKWIVVAIIVAAVIYFLARAVYRHRAKRALAEIEEIHESLWSWSGFKDDFWLFLNMLGQRFKRKPKIASPRHYIDEDILGRLNIREIYQRLLWEGARGGIARRRHETASEYSERLGQTVPDSSEPLAQITDLYIGVRYGDISAQEEQTNHANSLWRFLHNLMWRLRGG
jgi:hypothetical protein